MSLLGVEQQLHVIKDIGACLILTRIVFGFLRICRNSPPVNILNLLLQTYLFQNRLVRLLVDCDFFISLY